MEITGGAGNIGNLPAKYGTIKLDSYDTHRLVGATAGLVKNLSIAGASALATLLLSALLTSDSETNSDPKIPLSSLAIVDLYKRKFVGVCCNESIEFECDNQNLTVTLDRINSFEWRNGFLMGRYCTIKLIDGSEYKPNRVLTESLDFFTVAGHQFVPICNTKMVKEKQIEDITEKTFFGLFNKTHSVEKEVNVEVECNETIAISGVTLDRVNQLKERLQFAIQNNQQTIINEIGPEIFCRYFEFSNNDTSN
ncbi:MAG: hypothetical protein JRG74_14295 [Deltaproteobacteria bacterium]|nr:hypothetical protein [Deltaproteobacteria bacterium]MBW2167203.1 hypothetical protein [Deltaproteobacteria bacterium]MBW2739503.1 hypothetical protein [Deltaproteobacteria bacterium]